MKFDRLIRLFKAPSASHRDTRNGQLQLKANDLGHCAVYEKDLQRFWPTTEENRKVKIAEFARKQGFRLAYYKQGHCSIFLKDTADDDIGPRGIFTLADQG